MKQQIAMLLAVSCLAMSLSGCNLLQGATDAASSVERQISDVIPSLQNQEGQSSESGQNGQTTAQEIALLTFTEADEFATKEYATDAIYDDVTEIVLQGSTASISGSGASISSGTITITAQGTYRISGSGSEVQIVVEATADDKVQLLLDGVSLQNSTTAPIYVKQADKVYITTAVGSENTITATFTADATDEEGVDAAIYAKDDLSFSGAGSLIIESTEAHGIVAKDDLVITSGSYTVTCAGKAFDANNSIRIAGGIFDVTSGKDAFHSEHSDDATLGYIYIVDGSFTIDAGGDAFDASAQLWISSGSFAITAGGGSANATETTGDSWGMMMPQQNSQNSRNTMMGGNSQTITDTDSDADVIDSTKALKAGTALTIESGTFTIDSSDDALHADYSVSVLGGSFSIQTGDDAITADTYTTVAGGSIDIITCYEGLEGQVVTLSGGEITMIATDDGINARSGSYGVSETAIYITGGSMTMDTSSEGDGIDSNGNIYMSGGSLLISSTTVTTDTSLDYNGDATITGGTFFATGSSGHTTQNFGEDSTQCSIFIEMNQSQTGAVSLTDSSGNVVVQFTPAKQYQTVTLSCAEIVLGETYTLTAGSYTETITMDSYLYGSGNESGMSSMFGGNTQGNMQGKR